MEAAQQLNTDTSFVVAVLYREPAFADGVSKSKGKISVLIKCALAWSGITKENLRVLQEIHTDHKRNPVLRTTLEAARPSARIAHGPLMP